MGPRPDALNVAIDEAWLAFDLPPPATTGVCRNCCMDPEIEADFLNRPARELPDAYVRDWYTAAYDETIRHGHVAWFLPRVMEMLADGKEVASVGNEVAFKRLPYAAFPERWPERQVAAVNRFALAFLDAKLGDEPALGWGDLDRLLCMFGEGGIDITPLLRRLDALSDDELADLLHRVWFYRHRGSIPFNAFWSHLPAKTQAWEWYISPALLGRMEQAAMDGNERALEVHDLIAIVRANDGL
ncbi:MAG: hypothetical protein J0L76_19400 [Rhodobacterales bacterium]|nr:hypothetical protein [Rhodobacterales bacterium]